MKKITYFYLVLICLVFLTGMSFAQGEAPRNPDSAKECAICHYRWIDTFFVDGRGTDLVEYQAENGRFKGTGI
jgi:hypothetical protein